MEFSKKNMFSSAHTCAYLPLLDYLQMATLQNSFFIASYTPRTLLKGFVCPILSAEQRWQLSVFHLQILKTMMWFFRSECFNDHLSTHITIEQLEGEQV